MHLEEYKKWRKWAYYHDKVMKIYHLMLFSSALIMNNMGLSNYLALNIISQCACEVMGIKTFEQWNWRWFFSSWSLVFLVFYLEDFFKYKVEKRIFTNRFLLAKRLHFKFSFLSCCLFSHECKDALNVIYVTLNVYLFFIQHCDSWHDL